MKTIAIFDPTGSDKLANYRGGGRIMQVLKENLSDSAIFVLDLTSIDQNATLLIPSWNPFSPPLLNKRIAHKQCLMIFDVIPLKYSSHFPAGIRGNFNLWRNKQALKHFDKIITISKHSKKDIVRYLNVPEEKVHVVYPSLSKIFFTSPVIARSETTKQSQANKKEIATPSARDDILPQRFALYVGDVNWNKNLVNLAKAIKIADVTCVFAGKMFDARGTPSSSTSGVDLEHPWMSEFKQFLEEVGNDKRFIFLGYVPDKELITLYQHAVCNVLVSHDEGFGFSYAEAASQQCPSALSDIEVFREIAGDTALFANPDNSEDIAEKIMMFVRDNNLRKTYGEKASQNIQSHFSPALFRKSLLDLLK